MVEALNCAVEIRGALKTENASLPPARRMEFRVGVNLGDVMVVARLSAKRVASVESITVEPAGSRASVPSSKPIWEVALEIGASVPEQELVSAETRRNHSGRPSNRRTI